MLICACLSVSCIHEVISDPSQSCEGKVEIGIGMTIEGGSCGNPVKSILPEDAIEDKLTDLTAASYDESGVMVDVQYYSDLSDIRLYISRNGENTIYAVANMGDMTSFFPSMEEDVSSLVYMIDSYDDIKDNGIPMCASMKASVSTNSPQLRLVRLFAKVNLRILHTSLDNSSSLTEYAFNLCNESLYVRQANRRLYPFSDAGSRAMTAQDIMDESDYNPDLDDRFVHPDPSRFGPGPGYWQDTTIVVYVPENRQGVLLPSNGDPYMKDAQSISSVNGMDYSGLCTYVELNTRKEALGTGLSGSVIYRCYLGADNVKDFNVERNGRYDVTLDLTQGSFGMDCWKVAKGDDWSDTRTLNFLQDTYVIYPGTSTDVFVHYNASAGPDTDSQTSPGAWTYSFDDSGMGAAGLSYVFDYFSLKQSPSGKMNFCFGFTASEDAVVGSGFPLTVTSADGSLVDESMIYIAEAGDLSLDWERLPLYVAQYGTVNVNGAVQSTLPLSAKVSDPSVMKCVATDGDSFRFVALKPGNTDVTFSNSTGTQTYVVNLKVEAPVLKMATTSIALNPDGAPLELDYSYIDSRGQRLSGFDDETFRNLLMPVVADNAYISTSVASDKVVIMIDRLYDDGVLINVGSLYGLTLKATDCEPAGTQYIEAYVIDPFDDIRLRDYGKIDDYTLFSAVNVNAKVRSHFSPMVSANSAFEYEAPSPVADKKYLVPDLVPEWSSGYSGSNGVYSISYDPDNLKYASGASFSISMNSVTAAVSHSVGKHQVGLSVVNRHSEEKIRHICGYVDVYLHTMLGARAEFGSQSCNYKPEGSGAYVPTFAGVYNDVAGTQLYSTQSGNSIYYMDVKAEFMTDVSKVYVLNMLLSGAKSGSDRYDAGSILQPSVKDGHSDINTWLLYSVNGNDSDRMSVAGEEYGYRKGIGVVLYRALRQQTYVTPLSESDLHAWFLGLNVNNVSNPAFSPCFEVHDKMNGIDKVDRTMPYYFAPSSYPSYVDDDGRGYHVIHFLEDMEPKTGGWINLL